ncbi:type IV secretory system conjugative DNA transfer family protein [Thermogemmatispora carboxidivorans]|uniref:type IV secretory system conjugative DNA transfer family protein n=1 Tax=Thermogemmatispora carboxidivorans TaxID=1382306 RepID=UPI00069B4588|nr:hypothetical protein [Thermogemmatispora carboxidivorans]
MRTSSGLPQQGSSPPEALLARQGHLRGSPHLLMIVPHAEGERQAAAMENWFQACSSDEAFALELAGTRREQVFLLRASSHEQLTLLAQQFHAQYPQAEQQRVVSGADPLLLRPGEHAVVGEFALAQPAWMPLKHFGGKALAEPGNDPLAGILAAMEPLASGERIVSQLALMRAPEGWISRYVRKSVEHPLQEERNQQTALRYGTSPDVAESREGLKVLLGLFGALAIIVGLRWYQAGFWPLLVTLAVLAFLAAVGLAWWRLRRKRGEIYDMKLVAEKLVRAAFYCQLRVIVIGQVTLSSEQQLRTHLARLEVAYRQFTLASANSLYLKHVRHLTATQRRAKSLLDPGSAFPYHHPLLRLLHGAPTKDVWNGLELSGAFHLPQEVTDLPLVRRLTVKRLLASPEIAYQIEHQPAPLPPALIGHSRQRGYCVPVYVPYSTLFAHKFLVARSRYGKSTLMALLIQAVMQPVQDGSTQPGVFVIDPHRDLIEELLLLIPEQRARDVLLLDMTDLQFPVALNPLDASMGFTRDQAIANLVSSFKQIWSDTWGPRMEHFLKNVCLLLYTLNEHLVNAGRAEEQFTLLDINPLLQYQDYALAVLHQLDPADPWHQELLAWWQNTYFLLPKASTFRQEIIMPILTKLGSFNDNQHLRRIVGQPVTRAPIHEAVTAGKIVLCALSARDMDDTSLNILGSTLINLLRRSFRLQEATEPQQRRPIFLAIDEFQAFSGADIAKILAEDAKYGCAALLATQFLKELDIVKKGLLDTVLANCENLWAFNVSASDARILEEELHNKVTPRHIISQPRLHCYARLALPGHPLQIVSIELIRPPSWNRTPSQLGRARAIRHVNQRRYQSAGEIDRAHADHIRRFLDVQSFALKIDQEVRKTQAYRQRRAAADQLAAQQLQAQTTSLAGQQGLPPASLAARSPQSTLAGGSAPPRISSVACPAAPAQGRGSSVPIQTRTQVDAPTGSLSTSPSPARGEASDPGEQGERKRRSHPRSRRKKRLSAIQKTPVGLPPPILPDEVPDDRDRMDTDRNGPQERRPSISWESTHGSFEEEGKERGERA